MRLWRLRDIALWVLMNELFKIWGLVRVVFQWPEPFFGFGHDFVVFRGRIIIAVVLSFHRCNFWFISVWEDNILFFILGSVYSVFIVLCVRIILSINDNRLTINILISFTSKLLLLSTPFLPEAPIFALIFLDFFNVRNIWVYFILTLPRVRFNLNPNLSSPHLFYVIPRLPLNSCWRGKFCVHRHFRYVLRSSYLWPDLW